MTDEQRRHFEEALAASLLLLYRGHAHDAMTTLYAEGATVGIALDVRQRVDAFAQDRADKVQRGINQRIEMALRDLPADASGAQIGAALANALREVSDYNSQVLQPYMESWARHTAQGDTYLVSTTQDGQNARAATQWIWAQHTDYADDCTEADVASPASYDELVAIAGGSPPVHERCACTLDPAE